MLHRLLVSLAMLMAVSQTCYSQGLYPDHFRAPSVGDWSTKVQRGPTFMQGSGDVIGTIPRETVATKSDGDININFVDAAIGEVARAVLGDILGLNYVISPSVSGNITLRTSRPLSRDAVLPVLEAALRLHGAALVESENVYQVVPLAEAPRSTSPIRTPRPSKLRTPGYAVQVVPLRFVSATEMEKVLTPVAPDGSILFVDSTRNVILLGGTSDELQNLTKLIGVFDIDYMQGMNFALVPLENSNAVEVASEVERIFNLNNQVEDGVQGAVRFMPIERISSVLVISADMAYVNHAFEWIRTLDQRDDAGQRLYVYQVQNGRAAEIADVLGSIFGAESTGSGQSDRDSVAPGYTPTLTESASTGAQRIGSTDSSSTSSLGKVGIAPAAKISPTTMTSEKAGSRVVQFKAQDSVRVVADPNSNQLVIYASAADYQTILSALTRIDVAPLQVQIEATIAEVTLTGGFEYGVEWFFNSVDASLDLSGENIARAIGDAATGAAQAFSYVATAQNIRATLKALSQQTDVRIIASPNIMVRDNQPAKIQIGDQVPVLTQQSVSTVSPGAPVINSVQYIDSGVILEVTPHVNASGLISLDLVQQISQPVPTSTSNIDSPSIQQRLIQTSVSVQSNDVVALGGLISETEAKGGQGLPAFRRIPVLGSLFGTKSKDSRRTEIIVLLTPRVIRDSWDARELTYELGERMRAIMPLGAAIQ